MNRHRVVIGALGVVLSGGEWFAYGAPSPQDGTDDQSTEASAGTAEPGDAFDGAVIGESEEGWEPEVVNPLLDLDLASLMQIDVEVASVTGFQEGVHGSPAAVFVLTGEEIRRSGARTVPDALRLVPGLFVGQVSSSEYSISARVFDFQIPSRFLVLIDGRSVYITPSVGYNWDSIFVPVEDIERIEVIRGSGASLWGSSAINGMISIVTRNAKDTLGGAVTVGAGDFEQHFAHLRYGWALSDSSFVRAWIGRRQRDSLESSQPPPEGFDSPEKGANLHDDSRVTYGGLRLDHAIDDQLQWTSIATASSVRRGVPQYVFEDAPPPDFFVLGLEAPDRRIFDASLVTELEQRTEEDRTDWMLRANFSHNEVRELLLEVDPVAFPERHSRIARDTLELEFRDFYDWNEWHRSAWGVGFRGDRASGHFAEMIDENGDSFELALHPIRQRVFSVFAQHRIELVPERWNALAGARWEHDLNGSPRVQASLRSTVTPASSTALWAAISFGRERPNEELLVLSFLYPRDPFRRQLWYESGWRQALGPHWALDTSAFVRSVLGVELDPGTSMERHRDVNYYGGETRIDYRVSSWTARASYSWVKRSQSLGLAPVEYPRHQANLSSLLDLTERLEWNTFLSFTDRISYEEIGDHLNLHTGLVWHARDDLQISAWGRNLLGPGHEEFSDFFFRFPYAKVPRSFHVAVQARF